MFNLIKMDIHRLLHSASTWIIVAFAVIAAIFSIVMTNMDIQAAQENGTSTVVEDTSSEALVGIQVTGNEEWANGKIELGDVISMEVQSGLTAILCVIFAALFANADQKNGYIKNIVGQFPRRGKLVLSKFVATAVQVFLILFVFVLVAIISSFIFWGDKVYMGAWIPFVKALGIQYLLHLGMAALIMFLSILTRSNAFSTTAGILLCSGVSVYLYMGINKIISNIKPNWNFDINNYVLESNIKMIGVDTAADVMLRGAIVGVTFVIISIVLAMVTMKKRDVR